MKPSTNGKDMEGRTPTGQFAPGWKGGPGNPQAGMVLKLRAKMLDTITAGDIALAIRTYRRVMKSETAKDSDKISAANAFLTRVFGTPANTEIVERIEALEANAQPQRNNGHGGREHLS